MSAKTFTIAIERGTQAIPCECGGYCDRADCTDEELLKHGCGRERMALQIAVRLGIRFECCARAFECRICHARYAGKQPAPDTD